MTALAVLNPIAQFFDLEGGPLDNGLLYFGVANQNPEVNPVTVTWDAASIIPVAQPVSTLNGYPARSGSPAAVYAASNFSLLVRDRKGRVVFYAPDSADFGNAASLQAMITQFIANLADPTDPAKGDALVAVKRTIVGSVPTTLHDWIEGTVLDASRDFKVVADGVTDQTAKMLVAISSCTVLAPCTLELPRGAIYCATSLGNLAVNGLTIRGKGMLETTLKFGHSGVAMLADAFASGSPADPFVRTNLLDFTIQGNANTTHLLQAQGIARSDLRLNAKDANTASGIAFHLKGVMLSNLRLWCSTDVNSMSFLPSEGLRLEAGTRAGVSVGNSSNDELPSCRFVGLPIGVRLSGADQCVFVSGSSETCSTYGVIVATGSRYNTFIGYGLESPGATADFADAGESTRIINCYSAKAVQLQGRGCKIDGGFFERIEVQGGAVKNVVEGVRLNNWRTGSGGFIDNGTATEWKNLRGTTLTATFATSVMTVTAAAQGRIAVGDEVFADGVSAGTTVTSFGTGTGGTGTYNLSTSPGTLSSRTVSTGGYVYPLKSRTGISLGASPFTWANTTGQYVEVIVQSGTVTQIRQGRDGDFWLKPNVSATCHLLPPGDQIEVSYSVAPTISYVPHNGFQG